MKKLWKNQGLDLLLKPYGCIATGNEIGMIEVVLNADTTANINKAAGGTKAVLKEDTLTKWLKQHNPPEKMKKVRVCIVYHLLFFLYQKPLFYVCRLKICD